jgi:hypothetical protein
MLKVVLERLPSSSPALLSQIDRNGQKNASSSNYGAHTKTFSISFFLFSGGINLVLLL